MALWRTALHKKIYTKNRNNSYSFLSLLQVKIRHWIGAMLKRCLNFSNYSMFLSSSVSIGQLALQKIRITGYQFWSFDFGLLSRDCHWPVQLCRSRLPRIWTSLGLALDPFSVPIVTKKFLNLCFIAIMISILIHFPASGWLATQIMFMRRVRFLLAFT